MSNATNELEAEQARVKRLRTLLERTQQILVRHQAADEGHCPECQERIKQDRAHAEGCEWNAIMTAVK
jgi:hypothetical protein